MIHPLDPVEDKVNRAAEHATALRKKLSNLKPAEYYKAIQKDGPKRDKQGRKWVHGYLEVLKEPPLELGILAGDWAHNLRGSLDHLIYQLAVLDTPNGKKVPETTFFPIAKSEPEYTRPGPCNSQSLRDKALAGISEPHRALIDAEQPYYPDHGHEYVDWHVLSVLNAFYNTDKHRIVNPAAVRPSSIEAVPVFGTFPTELRLPSKQGSVIGDGAHIYSVALPRAGDLDVPVKVTVKFSIGFGNKGLSDANFLNMCETVRALIRRYRPLWT